ncbi:NAD-dependent epimerase/dehydratase family protein [Mycolicibacterium lacusdiani]|uniref:NAD-dependent epimerase/dehydratase family protein n=1 Tax=Mycolicibacterium lacusdiani TaxID=2895283 RepID=UPI001F0227A2|nr:NAD-dependent epimerase/dehydratase family protein [Mycolicibacterium lacusdiani]
MSSSLVSPGEERTPESPWSGAQYAISRLSDGRSALRSHTRRASRSPHQLCSLAQLQTVRAAGPTRLPHHRLKAAATPLNPSPPHGAGPSLAVRTVRDYGFSRVPGRARRCESALVTSHADQPRILVTGAAGYVGSHVVNQLLRSGYTVRAATRSERRAQEVLDTVASQGLDPHDVEFAVADLTADEGWPRQILHQRPQDRLKQTPADFGHLSAHRHRMGQVYCRRVRADVEHPRRVARSRIRLSLWVEKQRDRRPMSAFAAYLPNPRSLTFFWCCPLPQ